MFRIPFRLAPAAAAAAVLTAASPSASALIIDTFDDGAFALEVIGSANNGSPVLSDSLTSTGSTANIIGGTRKARLDLRDGRGVVNARTLGAVPGAGGTAAAFDDGVLSVSDSSRAFSNFFLEYGNLGGVDITEGGIQSALAIDYSFFQGFSRVEAVISTGTGTANKAIFVKESENDLTIGPAARANAQTVVFQLADFNGTADFSDVDRIRFFFQNRDTDLGGATDFEIGTISTVPEPASLVLFAAGAGLIGFRRRRN